MSRASLRFSLTVALVAGCLVLAPGLSEAKIPGLTGTAFDLTASQGVITAGDGNTITVWGFGVSGGTVQYPGPTLILNQGDAVTINLTNQLPVNVSMVFPGMDAVTSIGGVPGLIAQEAAAGGGTVSYSFVASRPGTFYYQSGTQPELQTEMGLLGAIIVRPAGFDPVSNRTAYGPPETAYDYEYLFLITEMDHRIHELVEDGRMAEVDNTAWFPYYWFINGRNAPDTMAPAFAEWLPTQPYNALPRVHPGERMLFRVIGGGRDAHPFHHHGNNSTLIARDAHLLARTPGGAPDLAVSYFTIPVYPGLTYDSIWDPWTGAGLGWDVYGHAPGDALAPSEDPADHGKPIPVILPQQNELTYGQFYSGSPFLGSLGTLPPGEGGFNMHGGLFYMFHSHNEKEMINNDVFPGGMMTMIIVEPHGVPIEQ